MYASCLYGRMRRHKEGEAAEGQEGAVVEGEDRGEGGGEVEGQSVRSRTTILISTSRDRGQSRCVYRA
jgi:hypothetical protein